MEYKKFGTLESSVLCALLIVVLLWEKKEYDRKYDRSWATFALHDHAEMD